MWKLCRFLNLPHPLFETPGDGGGGSWPEYEVPEEVGEGQPAGGGQPAAGAPAGGAQPAAGQPGGQPGAGQPGGQPARDAGTGGQPGGQPGRRPLPAYREEQIAERRALQTRLDTIEAENKAFKSAIAKSLGLETGQPAQDPRSQRLRETLFNIVPELKELVEKLLPNSKALMGLAESAPQWTEQTQNYWRGVATRTIDQVNDGIAKALLGNDKAGKDLDPEMADDVKDSFIRWCERDKTGARVQRYEAQDSGLVKEFLQAFTSRYVDPVRRSAAITVTNRGQAINRLPQSGGGGAPVAAQPPAVDKTNPDAVHDRGWEVLQQLRGS